MRLHRHAVHLTHVILAGETCGTSYMLYELLGVEPWQVYM